MEQVAFADRILLNKVDLVKDTKELDEIEKEVKVINSNAPIFRCVNSVVNPKNLIDIGSFDLKKTLEMDPEFLDTEGEHEHDQTVTSVSCKFKGDLNVNKLNSWIGTLIRTKANDLFRYKGVLAVRGMEKKFVFQGVHMLFSGGFNDYDAKWKQGETRECGFCFIGRNLDKKMLQDGFMACKAKDKLRFKVGDIVEANVGGYRRGRIIKVWDEGDPYRVQLDDAQKTLCGPPPTRTRTSDALGTAAGSKAGAPLSPIHPKGEIVTVGGVK